MSVVALGGVSVNNPLDVSAAADYKQVLSDIHSTAGEAVQEIWTTLAEPVTVLSEALLGSSASSLENAPAQLPVQQLDCSSAVPALSPPLPKEAAEPCLTGGGSSSGTTSPARCGCTAGLGAVLRGSWQKRRHNRLQDQSRSKVGAMGESEVFADDYVREIPTAANYKESSAATRRHAEEAEWSTTVLLYDASPDPPASTGAARERLRRAYHMPVNSERASRIDNSSFSGSFLFLHREPEADLNTSGKRSPYEWHFAGKTRRWEARVQGRFRRKPVGTLYTGCVLEDFNYETPQSWAASMLSAAVVPLMEAVVGERFYFAWGTRGPAADTENAELGTIVTCLAGVDQVIVCPRGEQPVEIHEDISELGFRRNAMSSSEYHAAVQRVVDEIDLEKTYTFCVWGCSRYIDVLRSSFAGIMGLGSMSYGSYIDEWPAHFILYSLEDDPEDPTHLERKKRYFIDVMVWSSNMHMPRLPSRYRFLDQKVCR